MRYNRQAAADVRVSILTNKKPLNRDVNNDTKVNVKDALVYKKDIDFLILSTGTSNMQVWGTRGDPTGTESPDPRIIGFNAESNVMDFQIADIRTSSLGLIGGQTQFREPIFTGPVTHRINLSRTEARRNENWVPTAFVFAKEYLKDHPNAKVGIVVHGIGALCMPEWISEAGLDYTSVHGRPTVSTARAYKDVEAIMKVALQRTKKGKADVMIWGCTTADRYLQNQVEIQKQVILQFRNRDWVDDNAPMLFTHATGNSTASAANEPVNVRCQQVADETPRVACIDSEGLTVQTGPPYPFEPYHYDTAAVRQLGKMYYQAWKNIDS